MSSEPPVPVFPKLDPATPAFWDVRFSANFTPWDRGGPPADFLAFVQQMPPCRTLIPGCGNADEVGYLIKCGWDVTAIDFSSVAVARAKQQLESNGLPGRHVVEADFFDPCGAAVPFELVYESAFLCALPPAIRCDWALQVARVTAAGGVLAGYFFINGDIKGPPFGITEDALHALLSPHFDLIDCRIPGDSIAVFQGKERWMVWRRR